MIWCGLALWYINDCRFLNAKSSLSYLPTPPLGQDMTQGLNNRLNNRSEFIVCLLLD